MLLFHVYMVVKTINVIVLAWLIPERRKIKESQMIDNLLVLVTCYIKQCFPANLNGPVAHGNTDIAHRGLQLI